MLPVKHLVQKYSKGPNVTFAAVLSHCLFGEINLRSHSIRGPTFPAIDLQLIAHILSQSKVSELDDSVIDEDVLELEVAVDEVVRLKNIHPLYYLLEVVQHLLQVVVTHLHFLSKVSFAVLEDQEVRVLMGENAEDFYDVRGIEPFETFGFA